MHQTNDYTVETNFELHKKLPQIYCALERLSFFLVFADISPGLLYPHSEETSWDEDDERGDAGVDTDPCSGHWTRNCSMGSKVPLLSKLSPALAVLCSHPAIGQTLEYWALIGQNIRILSCDWLIGYLALYWVASSKSDRNCFPAQWYGPSLWNVASNDLKIMIQNQLHKRSEIFNKYLVLESDIYLQSSVPSCATSSRNFDIGE